MCVTTVRKEVSEFVAAVDAVRLSRIAILQVAIGQALSAPLPLPRNPFISSLTGSAELSSPAGVSGTDLRIYDTPRRRGQSIENLILGFVTLHTAPGLLHRPNGRHFGGGVGTRHGALHLGVV